MGDRLRRALADLLRSDSAPRSAQPSSPKFMLHLAMNRNTKLTLLVAGLILIGFVVGLAAGAGGEDPKATAETVTVVSTDTVTRTETRTETVTHTRTRYRMRVQVKYRTVTEPAPEPLAGSGGGDDDSGSAGCSPEYTGACVPDDGYDVDCSDLAESDFSSVGSDPDGLDADGDGVACES